MFVYKIAFTLTSFFLMKNLFLFYTVFLQWLLYNGCFVIIIQYLLNNRNSIKQKSKKITDVNIKISTGR